MKKCLLFLGVLFMSIHLTTVSAETFASYYPGGKNYINPDNIVVAITSAMPATIQLHACRLSFEHGGVCVRKAHQNVQHIVCRERGTSTCNHVGVLD